MLSNSRDPVRSARAELSYWQGRCALEAGIDSYELTNEALGRMARKISAAHLPQSDPRPAIAAGVLAILDGIRDGSPTDEERLERGFVVCDALYAYCSRAMRAIFDI